VIRVAQIIGNIYEGGVESCILNYYKAIDRTQVCFDFFVERTSKVVDKELIESLGGRVIIVPHYTHLFKYLKCLRKAFREGNYDIVHANMSTLNVFPLYCAWREGVNVRVSHAHNTANSKEKIRSLIKNLLRPFASLFATARFACGDYSGRWLFGKKEFSIVNNAVDLKRFQFNNDGRLKIRKQLEVEDKFVIGHIGRFAPQKNHRFLLDVFKLVLDRLPQARLLLIGEGPLFEETRQYAVELGISGCVIFAGTTSDTSAYYQAMDCFVLPSLYEGLPVVSVEAQTNGLKAFFSDKITTEAKLIDSTEFLSIENAQIWAEKIVEFENEYNFSEELRAQRFKELEKTKYNIEKEAEKLLKLYKELT